MKTSIKKAPPAQSFVASFSLLLLIIVAVTFYEVLARYVFDAPTIWANEMALWLSAILYIAAGVYVMQRDQHLRITVLYDASPAWLKRVFDLIQLVCILVYCLGVSWFGWPTSWQSLKTWERYGTAWNPPIPATIKPAIVLGAALIAIYAVIICIRKFRGIDTHSLGEEDARVD